MRKMCKRVNLPDNICASGSKGGFNRDNAINQTELEQRCFWVLFVEPQSMDLRRNGGFAAKDNQWFEDKGNLIRPHIWMGVKAWPGIIICPVGAFGTSLILQLTKRGNIRWVPIAVARGQQFSEFGLPVCVTKGFGARET